MATRIIPAMAAVPDRLAPEIVDLARVTVSELQDLLAEEAVAWRTSLHWDFTPSADLVRRFVRIRALSGYALRFGGKVVGYAYYVCEDGKALIGDLYLARAFDTAGNAQLLVSAMLEAIFRTPGVRRVEGQMMLVHGAFDRIAPFARYATAFPRLLMVIDLGDVGQLPPKLIPEMQIVPWNSGLLDEAGMTIASAYHGHVDARINDQYRTWLGARRFLANVIQYPGCGHFQEHASLMALADVDQVRGMLLASAVAEDTGHITQLCVAPEMRGSGLGYELMRQSLTRLAEGGCTRASLTVTASNGEAVHLYQRMGFRPERRFSAYVWEGF